MPLVPPGVSVMGLPEDAVCCSKLLPMELRPPVFGKVASWMVPS